MATGIAPAGTSYTIGGVRVEFPCKAYPTQLSMMSMIIKGIERHQNCLLESPTGSGKSLALLCSCLAWQKNEYKKREEEDKQADCKKDESPGKIICTCDCSKTSPPPAPLSKPCTATSPPSDLSAGNGVTVALPCSSNGLCQPPTSIENGCNQEAKSSSLQAESTDDDEEADFQPSKKRYRTSGASGGTCKKSKGAQGVVFEDPSEDNSPDAKTHPHTEAHWQMKVGTGSVSEDSVKTSCQCPCHSSKEKDADGKPKEIYKPRRIPRIYFGTRTHKQITQIVRELGRTAYKDVPMCILGSREYTCVHPDVSRSFNKNDGCKELLEGRNGLSCRYYNGAHKIKNQWQIRDRGLTQAWDIEDLVSLGKKIKACPYFAVRSLKDEADIVFCPYNYLVDPMIRSTMDINMKNQIVVLDEAHNIEDSAREAASCSVTADQLEETVAELDSHITHHWREYHCRVMHTVSAALLEWLKSHSSNLTQRDFERALRVWSGSDIVTVLTSLGITKDTLGTFQHHLAAILEEAEPQKKEQENGVTLSSLSGMTLKGLFLIFDFLFKYDMKYMKDFKVAIVKTAAKANRSRNTDNRWISKRRSTESSWTLTLNFWCLNPAVAFTDFGEEARTIVLTSGTLSPMSSFQSELGVTFPIQLEANHVVHKSQVWVGTVAMGTNGGSLNASYKNAETYSFQDEIGLLLLQVCQVVPYGVLCFLPSYGMMNKLSARWKNTGLWDQLEKVKVVMSEARGADKANFDEHLREFYEVIKDSENTDIENQAVTGAVFLAVCRGKVSEGMDFADNNARAVMTIGIPFPSIKDTQVELKRQYNDQYSASRGLLTGSEWYEIQAYRAINQALGRCIRHKRDWGALILVDDRYSRNPKKYITGLSKWVRGKVVHHTHARDMLASLDEFAKARLLSPCPQLPSLSVCASPSPSQSLNGTFTPTQELPLTPAPSTPSSTQPLPHNDSGAASVLRSMVVQAQQAQTLGTPTPMKFFSSAGVPCTPCATGCWVPGTGAPSAGGFVLSTPTTVIQTPTVGTIQQVVARPLNSNVMIPVQANTLMTAYPAPTVTPVPLQGRLVQRVDHSGQKMLPLLLTTPGNTRLTCGQVPVNSPVLNVLPLREVVSSTVTVASVFSAGPTSTGRGEAPPKGNSAEGKEDFSGLKESSSSIKNVTSTVGLQSESAYPLKRGQNGSPENLNQFEIADVRTPKEKLIFEGESAPLQGCLESAGEDLDPSQFVDLTVEEKQAEGSFCLPDSQGSHTRTSVDTAQPDIQQMEEQRAEHDCTPLLFDSEDTTPCDDGRQRSPCSSVTTRGCNNGSIELTETQPKFDADDQGNVPGIQTLELTTPTKSFVVDLTTPDSKLVTNQKRSSSKKPKSKNPDFQVGGDRGRQTRSRQQISLRRSSRCRKKSGNACLGVDEPDAGGDFLDDIASKSSQKQAANETLCRVGLHCASCGCCFTEDTTDVGLVSEDEIVTNFSYLASRGKLTNTRTRKLNHVVGDFCQCNDNRGTAKGPPKCGRVDAGFYKLAAGVLRNVSTHLEGSAWSKRDFALNAHWSEEDQCCYQPITCSVCRSKKNATSPVIGYKLVAVGPCHKSSAAPGQVWLFPKDVAHCRRFTPQNDSSLHLKR